MPDEARGGEDRGRRVVVFQRPVHDAEYRPPSASHRYHEGLHKHKAQAVRGHGDSAQLVQHVPVGNTTMVMYPAVIHSHSHDRSHLEALALVCELEQANCFLDLIACLR